MIKAMLLTAALIILAAPAAAQTSSSSSSTSTGGSDPLCFDNFSPPPGLCSGGRRIGDATPVPAPPAFWLFAAAVTALLARRRSA